MTHVSRRVSIATAFVLGLAVQAGAQQLLDDSWTVTANGQVVQVNADGTFRIANIPSPDEFGAGGQGTPPDFVGDDYVRVTGTSTSGGVTRWLFSEPFLIEDGSIFTVQQLVITDTPPPLPVSIDVDILTPTLTVPGQITSLETTAELADGSVVDVTPQTSWTTYTSSNPAIATVGPDGQVTALGDGLAYLTAENDGATATTKVVVSLGDPLTTVEGRVVDADGVPVPGALVIATNSAQSTTGASGQFSLADVPTQLGDISVFATADLGSGSSGSIDPFPGGITDVGDVVLLPTSEGEDFVVCFPRNYEANASCSLLIGSTFEANGVVSVPGLDLEIPFQVLPDIVTTVDLPSTIQVVDEQQVVDLGIGVTADAPITVYGLNRIAFSTDAYTAFPVGTAGTRYRVLSHSASVNGPSQLTVVGISDGTEVQIIPSSDTPIGTAGEPITVELDALQAYLLTGEDLTGSLVTSTSPVSVFGGHECGNVPVGFNFCDHLVEQLPPVVYWGSEHLTVSLAGREGGDTYRIVTDTPNTAIEIEGTTPGEYTLDPDTFLDLVLDGTNTISSDAPVLICQYAHGRTYDGITGDPFMGMVAPIERFRESYTFTSPPSGFATHYVNVVLRNEDLSSVVLDGSPLAPLSVETIGSSGYVGARVAVSPGCHTLSAPNPVGLYVYGFNTDDSYGYAGGL